MQNVAVPPKLVIRNKMQKNVAIVVISREVLQLTIGKRIKVAG